MLTIFPKQIANKATICYMLSLLTVAIVFMDQTMPLYLYIFGIVAVLTFFYGSANLSKRWHNIPNKMFKNRLFISAFLLRLTYVIFIYFFNEHLYGNHHESNIGDIEFYISSGLEIAENIRNGHWGIINDFISWNVSIDDMGYNVYLALIYLLTNSCSDIFIPLLIKAFWGSMTCIEIYKIARRHFGENTGRMASLFCMLQFNMIWWCGSMMKETEMLFLTILAIERIDKILSTKHFSIIDIAIAVLATASLLTFRTVLTILIIMAFVATVFVGSNKITSISKKIISGIIVAILLIGSFGTTLTESAKEMARNAGGEYQEKNMMARAQKKGGNSFAIYASSVIFAPLIFTIPFPSITYTNKGQEMQMQVNGGNFIKNIMSFFVIIACFSLLLSGKWREHSFPLMFLCGYLFSLVFSVFAQSGRFHMVAIPFEMMFAAYGMSLLNSKKYQYFKWALLLEFMFCIIWSYIKLGGRGLL